MFKKRHILSLFFCWLVGMSLVSCGIKKSVNNLPELVSYNSDIPKKLEINDSTCSIGNNFLTKNKQGLWELYVEGDPLEIGLITGQLTQDLIYKQETVFYDKIKELVPSEGRQKFLRTFLSWYNRKMYRHVRPEYQSEIYGMSQYMSDDFNGVATPYLRALYLQGAHDIGHAVKDLMLVGCTSFAAWDEKTEDGELLIGRNFDFYAGDEFAENKIISFINPDNGYKFMSVTWAGFVGVVSGMNEKGLTVTINAGKSKIPWVAKTPISIVTREILQYASNIEEAIAIAKKREVFVSEAIMVGSAKDKKAVLIEVSPNKFGVYDVENSNQLICSNHFQSAVYEDDSRNHKAIEESHSKYRYQRMAELLSEEEKLNPEKSVAILRNKEGLNDSSIGFGNEKAINQLLAHHGIVFKPEDLKVWVSASPYQLGEFVAYDLNDVFKMGNQSRSHRSLSEADLNIPEDPFVHSEAFHDYEAYRVLITQVENAINNNLSIDEKELHNLITYNPNYWKAHYAVGLYLYKHKRYSEALKNFETAATKEITTISDEELLAKYIRKSKRKAQR